MVILALPREGFEPTLPCGKRILSPPRLPFRHLGMQAPEHRLPQVEEGQDPGQTGKAASGLEPLIGVLQTPALTSWLRRHRSPMGIMERKTGFEPATSSLARRRSTAELLPHGRYSTSSPTPVQGVENAEGET